MIIVKTIKEVREKIKEWRDAGLSVGLVPTMGYLHEGHASLIKTSSSANDRLSRFVKMVPISTSGRAQMMSVFRCSNL